eukprot:1182712-Rhodomonas_salina.2
MAPPRSVPDIAHRTYPGGIQVDYHSPRVAGTEPAVPGRRIPRMSTGQGVAGAASVPDSASRDA